MDVVKLFKRGFDIFKVNYVVAAPILVINLVVLALMIALMGGAMVGAGGMMAFGKGLSVGALGAAFGLFWLLLILAVISTLVAYGAAMGMVKEAIETGKTTLYTGINVAKSRIADLVVAAIIVGVLIFVGMMLLLLPGLIAAFLLMLTFPALILDSLAPVDAIKKSYATVISNLGDALMLVVLMIVVFFVVGVANMVIGFIPFLGQLAVLIINSALGGYVAAVLVLFYTEAKK